MTRFATTDANNNSSSSAADSKHQQNSRQGTGGSRSSRSNGADAGDRQRTHRKSRRHRGSRARTREPKEPARAAPPTQAPKTDSLSERLSRQISEQILEHTKQLGLFDEMRVRLLAEISACHEFAAIEREFKGEVDRFCSRADLSLPRARLREQLSEDSLAKSAARLRRHIRQVSREHHAKLRRAFDECAAKFLADRYQLRTLKGAPAELADPQRSPEQSTPSEPPVEFAGERPALVSVELDTSAMIDALTSQRGQPLPCWLS